MQFGVHGSIKKNDAKPVVNWIRRTHTLGAPQKSSVLSVVMLMYLIFVNNTMYFRAQGQGSIKYNRCEACYELYCANTSIGCIFKVMCHQAMPERVLVHISANIGRILL